MIIHVETHQRARHAELVEAYFRLRKEVFCDRLKWDVPVSGDFERDVLDDHPCTYALSVDAAGNLSAGIRLIPTTQTTLLEIAFDGLIPPEYNFRSPTIWELSRFCVDQQSPAGRLPAGLDKATLALTLANFDYARRNGITHYLTVTEGRMLRLTQQFGVPAELLGQRTIEGCEVVCGLIPVNAETAALARRMRPFVERFDADDQTVTCTAPPCDKDARLHDRERVEKSGNRETAGQLKPARQA
jgi:N-acyl-L-homoserine lactone synthetase